MIEPDGVLKDLGRESMAFVQGGGSSHAAIVASAELTWQYPIIDVSLGSKNRRQWPMAGSHGGSLRAFRAIE